MAASQPARELARQPEDLGPLLLARLNAGDVEGVVALYEAEAALAIGPAGQTATGTDAIRAFYADLLASKPQFEPGEPRPTVRTGKLALTSTRLPNGTVTAEVARQQADGRWLWAIDQPNIARDRQRA